MSLLADYNLPFAISLGVMLLLCLMQIIGVGDMDFDADVDLDADIDATAPAGIGGAVTTLLGIGRVPFLVWLIVLLFLFSAIGVGVQSLAQSLTGSPLYPWLAAVLAIGTAVPATGAVVRPLGRILPHDETSAVGLGTLVGRRAEITTGRAARGYPARAKVRDQYGHAHHVMVEPHEETGEFMEGDEVLLVRREGQTFFAVSLAERKLAPIA